MERLPIRTTILCLGLLFAGVSAADEPAAPPAPPANPLDAVPDKMPFNTPYGAPISLQRAEAAIQAAKVEAEKRGWQMNIAVVDSGANLVTMIRMDGAQLASVAICEHKARTAAKYRRPTRIFEDAVQKSHFEYVLSLDDIVTSRGGIPLVEGGKLIGAIGCSGGTGSQDEVVCTAGAATINK
ncbi:MAG TPA: heme-binding protein [Burkholderiaceae bacterium]